MTVKASRLGPGRLTIGAVGSPQEFGSQVTKMTITPESSDGDAIAVLSGEEVVDDAADTYKLEGEMFQSYGVDSLIKWTWDNHRAELPFTFVPDLAGALQVTGTCRVKRVPIGGDVKTKNTAAFEFAGVGEPILTETAGGE